MKNAQDLNFSSKNEWNSRWDNEYIYARTFEEYRSQMGGIVSDLLIDLKLLFDSYNFRNKKILDIGGGYGAILKLMLDETNDKVLVDLSEKGIEIAKEKYQLKNSFAIDILTDNLPFDYKFDVILLNEVIEHIIPSDLNKLLNKIHDLLNENGIVIISTPNIASFTSRIRLFFGKLPITFLLDDTHVSVFTASTLNSKLVYNGFENVLIRTTPIRYVSRNIKLPIRMNLGEHLLGVWKKS